MKKLLLVACLLPVLATAAIAQEIDGGALKVSGQKSIGAPGTLSAAVLTAAYSNVTNFTGLVLTNGGTALQGANRITTLIADDCTPLPGTSGLDVTGFTFSAANLNSVAVSFRPRVRFWNADGVGGAPGTYYSVPAAVGFSFNPITLPASTITLLTATLAPGSFQMPGVTFWAGLTFDNNGGGTGATSAQMNGLGQGLFSPATVGSSADVFFQTTAAGSFFNINNPAGSLFNLGGDPQASFAWEFVVDRPVPTNATTWGRMKTLYR